MKKTLILLIAVGLFAVPAMAKKPEWAGKGKPTKEQLEAHQAAMKAKAKDNAGPRPKGNEDQVKDQYEQEKAKAKKEKTRSEKDKQQKKQKKEKNKGEQPAAIAEDDIQAID
jgi:hypothetical protein